MSHHASPIQSSTTRRQQNVLDHQESETFDLFADVSHHGPALVELFSFPSSAMDTTFDTAIDHQNNSQQNSTSKQNISLIPNTSTSPNLSSNSPSTPNHPSSNVSLPVHPQSTFDASVHELYSQFPNHSHQLSTASRPSQNACNPVQSANLQLSSNPANSSYPQNKKSTSSKKVNNIHHKTSTLLANDKKPSKISNNDSNPITSEDKNIKTVKKSVAVTKAIAKPRSNQPAQGSSASLGNTKKKNRTNGALSKGSSDLRINSKDAINYSEASEESDDLVDSSTSKRQDQNSRNQSQQPLADTLSATDGPNKDTHNSHTRKCRAKVNSKFQELLQILPAPSSKTGIKHKAQILDYTIRVFRDFHARNTMLEAELALSSRVQLNAWIDNVVRRSFSLQDALAPYLSLVCTKGGWKYSEAWVPVQEPSKSVDTGNGIEAISGESRLFTPSSLSTGPHSKLRLGRAVVPSLGNTDDPDLQFKLERFRDKSRPYGCKARIDLPGRIMCTMRPEWLPSLEDDEAFQRARLAREASLVVCFGVPIFWRGHVAAVAVFFDTEQRPYDAKCVDLADNVAILLGKRFEHATMKRAATVEMNFN